MKFLKNLDELSLKQKAVLNTIKAISGMIACLTVYIFLLVTYGWEFMMLSVAAFGVFVVVKCTYDYNVWNLQAEDREKKLEEDRKNRRKFLKED